MYDRYFTVTLQPTFFALFFGLSHRKCSFLTFDVNCGVTTKIINDESFTVYAVYVHCLCTSVTGEKGGHWGAPPLGFESYDVIITLNLTMLLHNN